VESLDKSNQSTGNYYMHTLRCVYRVSSDFQS